MIRASSEIEWGHVTIWAMAITCCILEIVNYKSHKRLLTHIQKSYITFFEMGLPTPKINLGLGTWDFLKTE